MSLVSIEAEQAVIGALLSNPAKFDDVFEIVQPGAFVDNKNRSIYQAICHLAEDSKPIDPLTVLDQLKADGHPQDHGYVGEIALNSASASNATSYAKIINDLKLKRGVLESANEIASFIHANPGAETNEIIDFAQSKVMGLQDSYTETTGIAINDALKKVVDQIDYRSQLEDPIDGLASGLIDLDNRTGGYHPGLIVIAGRPSQGKTTLALNIAGHASIKNKKRGLYFSFEMSDAELTEKLVACYGKIPLNSLKKPKSVDNSFWQKLTVAVSVCKDAPLHFVDVPTMHINQLCSYARKAHKREKLDYIVVDHIHLMEGDGDKNVDKFGSISRGLKKLSKELDIPVIALAQLSRKVEERANKRPMLSDLRESGRIEEDSDIVQFVYRDEYYNADTPDAGVMELITGKFRGGEVGVDKFTANLYCSLIDNFDYAAHKPVQRRSMVDSL